MLEEHNYSCSLSIATIEYSCLSVCSVCVAVCVCVFVSVVLVVNVLIFRVRAPYLSFGTL